MSTDWRDVTVTLQWLCRGIRRKLHRLTAWVWCNSCSRSPFQKKQLTSILSLIFIIHATVQSFQQCGRLKHNRPSEMLMCLYLHCIALEWMRDTEEKHIKQVSNNSLGESWFSFTSWTGCVQVALWDYTHSVELICTHGEHTEYLKEAFSFVS